jgi:molybdopterin-guanine dinucleotide biosynthesis protein A
VSIRGESADAPVAAQPLGAVLAGGMGRRIGGAKATVELRGRPLLSYPLAAMTAALADVAVIAKAQTELPPLPGVTVWIEPDELSHPLIGVLHALAMADGRAVLVCAGDLPFVTPAVISMLAAADSGGAPAVIAGGDDIEQPLLGRYEPRAAELLGALIHDPGIPLRRAMRQIGARVLQLEDPAALFNVNAREDLLRAAGLLDRRQRGCSPPAASRT